MNKSLIRLLVLLVVGAVVIGGVLGYFASTRSKDLKRLKAEGTKLLENSDLFKQDHPYFMQLFNHAQPVAEKSVNGILKPKIKDGDYYTALLAEMVRKAKADGKVEVAQKLRTYGTGRGWIDISLDK